MSLVDLRINGLIFYMKSFFFLEGGVPFSKGDTGVMVFVQVAMDF